MNLLSITGKNLFPSAFISTLVISVLATLSKNFLSYFPNLPLNISVLLSYPNMKHILIHNPYIADNSS